MLEFKWDLPDEEGQRVVLQVSRDTSWAARKRLLVGGRLIYNRNWLTGIDIQTTLPNRSERIFRLRNTPVPGSPDWRPVLFYDGNLVPELTADVSVPLIVPRPKDLSIVVGISLLAILVGTTCSAALAGVIEWFIGTSGYPVMGRWLLTFVLTAPCLAGYWDMRR